jgi:hypothetical protein
MLTFRIHIRTAWVDYFTGSPTLIQSKELGTQQTLSDTSVHVSNCLFRSITSGGNGGALSCSTSVTYFLVESSSFFSCKASGGYGGAIYFESSNGQSVLYEVCGYDCYLTYTSSNSRGHFSYIQVKDVITSKNYINYSSITRCGIDNSYSWYTLRNNNGKICCPSVNVSMNKCYDYSGIYCYPYSDSTSGTCLLSYSTFVDNIAIGYTCFWFARSGPNYEIKSCNILRNTQGTLGSQGTINTNGNLMIEDSCILENNANCIFYQGSSYTITVSNCTVDKTTSYGSFKIKNTVTKSFIFALNHMSTQNCHSEYDSAGTLTPILQSPSSSKKQIQCFTINKFLHQCRLSDVVLLTSFLIFYLIHPYTSGDLWC